MTTESLPQMRYSHVNEIHSHVKKEGRNQLGILGLRAATIGLFLGAATLLHAHPDITFFGGIGNDIYNAATTTGAWMGEHIPALNFVPHLLSQATENRVPSSLLVDIEVPTVLSAVRQGIHWAGKSHDHYSTHAHQVAQHLQAGKEVAGVPDHVSTYMFLLGLARAGLTALDVGAEAAEAVVDGPIPYGAKDVDAALFLALGWHPLTGQMNKGEKIALGVGAAFPWVPPLTFLAPYVLAEHLIGKKK